MDRIMVLSAATAICAAFATPSLAASCDPGGFQVVCETSGNTFDFGDVLVGDSKSISYFFEAEGATPGGFWEASFSDFDTEFRFENDTCNFSNSAITCALDVVFEPTETGLSTNILFVDYFNFNVSPEEAFSLTVGGEPSGTGIAPETPAIPLPAGLPLLLTGLAGLAIVRRRRET